MSPGLFAMLLGFLLPLALVIRLGVLIACARGCGWSHPLVLVLSSLLLLAMVPVVALMPSVWMVGTGKPIEAGVMALGYAATGWGTAKLLVSIVGVILTEASLPRICEQLVQEPIATSRPGRGYVMRDFGVLLICLLLAWATSVGR